MDIEELKEHAEKVHYETKKILMDDVSRMVDQVEKTLGRRLPLGVVETILHAANRGFALGKESKADELQPLFIEL